MCGEISSNPIKEGKESHIFTSHFDILSAHQFYEFDDVLPCHDENLSSHDLPSYEEEKDQDDEILVENDEMVDFCSPSHSSSSTTNNNINFSSPFQERLYHLQISQSNLLSHNHQPSHDLPSHNLPSSNDQNLSHNLLCVKILKINKV